MGTIARSIAGMLAMLFAGSMTTTRRMTATRRRRGQMSLEYVMILSMIFAILIPAVVFTYTYSLNSASRVEAAQYDKIGQEMLGMALQTAALGKGSYLTIDLVVPTSIVNISVEGSGGNELVIAYQTRNGITNAVFFTDINLSAGDEESVQQGSIYEGEARSGSNRFRFATGATGIVAIHDLFGPS